jgi:hypothetical protein
MPTRLDLRIVEDVVDDGQQGFAAGAHGLRIVALLVVDAGVEQQAGHADHGVERSTDLVAHVGEEHALGLHRRLGALLRRLQFAFARHLRRNVAQDHGIDHPAFGLQPRNRGFGGEFLAVLAHAADGAALAHAPRDVAGAAEVLHQFGMSGAHVRRQQQVDHLAGGFLATPAKDGLSAVVEQQDVQLLIEADHGIVGDAEDALQLRGGECGGGRWLGQIRLLSGPGRGGNARPRRRGRR